MTREEAEELGSDQDTSDLVDHTELGLYPADQHFHSFHKRHIFLL